MLGQMVDPSPRAAVKGDSPVEVVLWGVGGVFVLVVIVLVIREIVTWYWKINAMLAVLTRIEENTRPQRDRLPEEASDTKTPA